MSHISTFFIFFCFDVIPKKVGEPRSGLPVFVLVIIYSEITENFGYACAAGVVESDDNNNYNIVGVHFVIFYYDTGQASILRDIFSGGRETDRMVFFLYFYYV